MKVRLFPQRLEPFYGLDLRLESFGHLVEVPDELPARLHAFEQEFDALANLLSALWLAHEMAHRERGERVELAHQACQPVMAQDQAWWATIQAKADAPR